MKPVTTSTLIEAFVELCAPGETSGCSAAVFTTKSFAVHGARILLVEDNEINQQIAVELLTAAGAIVEIAANGRIAVEKVKGAEAQPPFDVVLMDIQMPEMDGYEATKQIRADGRFDELPIIAMTAHAMLEERQRCHDAGMIDHITKPIDPQAMFETISHWCKPCSGLQAGTFVATQPPKPVILEIPKIIGVDTIDGLARVAGNRKLYLSLLEMFVNSQGKSASAIEQALDGGDSELAHRLAHTAKGVAGNIGATGVHAIAGQFELSIRNAEPLHATRVLLEQFTAAMELLVANICAALGTRRIEQPVRVKPLDRAKVHSVIAKLSDYLDNSDSESGYYFESVRDSLLGEFSGEEIRDLEHSIGDYDFKSASRTLVAHAVGAERNNNDGK